MSRLFFDVFKLSQYSSNRGNKWPEASSEIVFKFRFSEMEQLTFSHLREPSKYCISKVFDLLAKSTGNFCVDRTFLLTSIPFKEHYTLVRSLVTNFYFLIFRCSD